MTDAVQKKIEAFFSDYGVRSYPKGQILILAGDAPDHVYYLVTGKVKQYEVSYHGDEVILNVFKPPAFFPMWLAINNTPNHYIFEAETDITVRLAPPDEAVQFVKTNPDVMFDLLSRVYRGLDGVFGRMIRLMSGSAKGRLMFEILIECRRFGEQQANGDYCLNISESDLGARAGLSRETVSREMHKLTEENLLKIAKGKITLFDLAKFEEKLGNIV